MGGGERRSTKGKTTVFNVYRSKYMRANALPADVDALAKRAHLVTCLKLVDCND